MRIATVSCFLSLIAITASAAEAPAPAVAETIIVTASAMEEPLATTPASATVISREEIERKKARDLVTVLREVPGLNVARSGTEGKQTSLFMRGANAVHTLVMWNGIEINVPYFGGFDWGQLSTAGVDRVEVVRGPYSAIYGSDAVAGVVNIISGQRDPGITTAVEAGENGLLGGRVDGAWRSGSLSLDAALDTRTDEGFRANDDFEQTAALASLKWRGGRGLTIGLAARFNEFDLGIPLNTNAAGDQLVPSLNRRQSGNELQIAIPITQDLGWTSWELTASRSDRTDEFSDPDDPFGFTSATTDSVVDRAVLTTRTPTVIGTIILGGEYENAEVYDTNAYDIPGSPTLNGVERSSHAFFIENRYSRTLGASRSLELSVGTRWDDYDTFGSHVSPRVAAAFVMGRGKVRAAWGEGFRAPSVAELYFPFGGNPGLNPEESRTWEIGYDHQIARGTTASITYFDSEYDNLIVYDNATFAFANAGAATVEGVEMSARWTGASLRAGGSWTILDTERLSTGRQLERRPRNSGSLSLGWSGRRVSGDVTVIHSGDRLDVQPVFPYASVGNDAWTTVDLAAEYSFGSLRPYIRVENLLDEEYEEVLGYPSASRRALIGVRWSLQ